MITLLAKWLIKAPPDAGDAQVRSRYSTLCVITGICLNLLLVAGKLVAGSLSGSIAIVADGLNNLSDAGSSVVTLIGIRLAGQKPDAGHPFGHGRMEYVTGLLVAVAVLFMGVELLRSSVQSILNPAPIVFSLLTAVILMASIGVKGYMAIYSRKIGKAIDSEPLRVISVDSLSDVAATLVVLVSMVVGHLTGLPIDGWCGLLVSLFILYAGFSALKDTVNLLLGRPPTRSFVQEIRRIVLSHPGIVGVHDTTVHDYGPGRRIVTLHAEVPANGDILALHDAVDNAERELETMLNCSALIHMDPIDTDDVLTEQTRKRVAQVVKGLDERVTIHDFRMVSGPTHTNLVFDVSVPFDVKLGERDIAARIDHMVRALDDRFFAVVTVDRVSLEDD